MSGPTQEDVERWIVDSLGLAGDEALTSAVAESDSHGLPSIQVDPTVGKLLNLLARMVRAERILEIGVLGGYSAIWLARALPEDGKLIALEANAQYAEVAEKNIAAAGLSDLVEIRVGPALETLPDVEGPFDLVFIDADKANQHNYLARALELTHVGSVIVGDNIVRGGRSLSDDDDASRGMRSFVELCATDPRLDATVVQTVGSKSWDGLAVALVVEPSD